MVLRVGMERKKKTAPTYVALRDVVYNISRPAWLLQFAVAVALWRWGLRTIIEAKKELDEINAVKELVKQQTADDVRRATQLALMRQLESEGPSEAHRVAFEKTLDYEQKLWKMLLQMRRAFRAEGETDDEKFYAFLDKHDILPVWDDIAERNYPEFVKDATGKWVKLPTIE